ncbi:MAG: ABC transporter substrate-binding protein [Desulfobacterales bacterium]|nr:ABC transporter substrate-binding protein [Desulfobacterales bacterium]
MVHGKARDHSAFHGYLASGPGRPARRSRSGATPAQMASPVPVRGILRGRGKGLLRRSRPGCHPAGGGSFHSLHRRGGIGSGRVRGEQHGPPDRPPQRKEGSGPRGDLPALPQRPPRPEGPGTFGPERFRGQDPDGHRRGEAEILTMFRNESVPLEKLKFVPQSWDLQDLVSGKVDAVTAYTTNEPIQMKAIGEEYVLVRPLTYGIDFYGTASSRRRRKPGDAPTAPRPSWRPASGAGNTP